MDPFDVGPNIDDGVGGEDAAPAANIELACDVFLACAAIAAPNTEAAVEELFDENIEGFSGGTVSTGDEAGVTGSGFKVASSNFNGDGLVSKKTIIFTFCLCWC